jgi:hypothetical protein
MERSAMGMVALRGKDPDFGSLHPGYQPPQVVFNLLKIKPFRRSNLWEPVSD